MASHSFVFVLLVIVQSVFYSVNICDCHYAINAYLLTYLFTYQGHFTRSPTNFTEAVRSICQNVQYFIEGMTDVLNFTAVKYSLHKYSDIILRH